MNPPSTYLTDPVSAPADRAASARRRPERLPTHISLRKALGTVLAVLLAFHAALFLLVGAFSLLYSFVNPPFTALMLYRRLVDGYASHPLRYVPLARVPRYAQRMFINVEDYTFYQNLGIDLKAILEAYRINRRPGHVYYGGSTITQQLARTLFLTPQRTYLRKYAELWAALEMDLLLSKRRTLELYVNYIELGKGIYGIGAAAEYHFGLPAARLDLDEYRRLVTIAASPLRYTMANFTRRRILSARYDYLLQAFPDPQTAPPPGSPPPPEVQSQAAQEPEGSSGQEPASGSGGGVEAGVVVPETQAGKTLPEPLHQQANP